MLGCLITNKKLHLVFEKNHFKSEMCSLILIRMKEMFGAPLILSLKGLLQHFLFLLLFLFLFKSSIWLKPAGDNSKPETLP